jgi:methyl-accepting chemotaxis protein
MIRNITEINHEMQKGVSKLSDLIDTSNKVSSQISDNTKILNTTTGGFAQDMKSLDLVDEKIADINGHISSSMQFSLRNVEAIQKMERLMDEFYTKIEDF